MRSDSSNPTKRRAGETDLKDGGPSSTSDAVDVTSRGAKYWNSGAIPLIAPEILGDIIAAVADLALVISDSGEVLSVLANPANDLVDQLGHWEGGDVRQTMTVESVPKFDDRLAAFLAEKNNVRPVELNHMDKKKGRWEFPVRYSFHRIGPDGAVLMLGRDLRPIAEMQQQLVKAQLALESDYETQREYDTRFRVLMDSATDAVVFASAHTGKITEMNKVAAELLGSTRDKVIGGAFNSCFEPSKRGDLLETLTSQALTEQTTKYATTVRRTGQQVHVLPRLFRAAGERVLLCRVTAVDQSVVPADDLMRNVASLYTEGPEAIAFTNDIGEVLAANESFLDLIDVSHDINVRGRSLADYLQRGSVDVKVMLENAGRAGRMRMYATKVASEYGSPRGVEISVTRLMAGPHTVFAFVMRDADHAEAGRTAANPTSEESMRSIIELVGSATLKDIVAETTNVVEKMCIQTAVELTMNNRVAAAEMLGLSRQSLYVKLRKFDLLSRDGDDNG